MDLRFYDLREDDFDDIIRLGIAVHGDNYVGHAMLDKIYRESCSLGLCCSKVVYTGPRKRGQLVGFRLTYAPGQWEIDEWCSTKKWRVPPEKVCYFKSNTVDADYRCQGIGAALLELSIATVKQMGAVAGITHIWMRSPGNSAYRYFRKAGGKDVRVWPARWVDDYEAFGYECSHCGKDCDCPGTEMILFFGEQK
jgi:GNAT superfamily N-acetyltransferase